MAASRARGSSARLPSAKMGVSRFEDIPPEARRQYGGSGRGRTRSTTPPRTRRRPRMSSAYVKRREAARQEALGQGQLQRLYQSEASAERKAAQQRGSRSTTAMLTGGIQSVEESIKGVATGGGQGWHRFSQWSVAQKSAAVIGGIFALILLYVMVTPTSNPRGVTIIKGFFGIIKSITSTTPMFVATGSGGSGVNGSSTAGVVPGAVVTGPTGATSPTHPTAPILGPNPFIA